MWERAVAAVLEWLGRLLASVIDAPGGAFLGSLLLGLVVVAAAVGLVRFLRSVRRDPGGGRPAPAGTGRPAVDWRAEAAEHEQARRWRHALRCHYRALIADLAADGVVEEMAGRTAGEYLAAVRRARPAAAQAMAELTASFEAAWYGEAPVGSEQVAALTEHAERVRA